MITPLIGLIVPGFKDIQDFKIGVFGIGNFIAAAINFIIIVKYAAKIGIE